MRRTRGFTLIELLVVIAIIGLLATVVAFNCTDILVGSSQKKVQADFSILDQAIEMYKMQTKKLPQRLDDLVGAGLVKKIPRDPWDHEYVYAAAGKRWTITSYGADGRPGGEGDERDLTNENIDDVVAGR